MGLSYLVFEIWLRTDNRRRTDRYRQPMHIRPLRRAGDNLKQTTAKNVDPTCQLWFVSNGNQLPKCSQKRHLAVLFWLRFIHRHCLSNRRSEPRIRHRIFSVSVSGTGLHASDTKVSVKNRCRFSCASYSSVLEWHYKCNAIIASLNLQNSLLRSRFVTIFKGKT